MERRDLESAAARVTYLRGLLAIPLGTLFVITGLSNLGWGPLDQLSPPAFGIVLLVLGGVGLLVARYYNDNYGRVTLSRRQRIRYGVASAALLGGAMVGGPMADFNADLPVSVFAASFALAMLAWFAICVGLRAHHLVIWGSLLVAGLLPVWGALPDRVSVAWLPIGAATMAAGIFDHRALVRSFGSADETHLENSNVGV